MVRWRARDCALRGRRLARCRRSRRSRRARSKRSARAWRRSDVRPHALGCEASRRLVRTAPAARRHSARARQPWRFLSHFPGLPPSSDAISPPVVFLTDELYRGAWRGCARGRPPRAPPRARGNAARAQRAASLPAATCGRGAADRGLRSATLRHAHVRRRQHRERFLARADPEAGMDDIGHSLCDGAATSCDMGARPRARGDPVCLRLRSWRRSRRERR